MKRKNILLLTQISVVLFLLLLSPVFAQNTYVISLDGGESFGMQDGNDKLDVSTAWTFEAWINVGGFTVVNEDCIMDRRTAFSFYLIDFGTVGDYAITFVARDAADINIATLRSDGGGVSETQMDFDTWYHVAATYDGTTARLYINSTETDANTDADWALTASGFGLTIGGKILLSSGTWAQQMSNTDIDEIRMSDIARAIGDMQTTTDSDPYSSDANTIFLMHLDDQAVSPSYITGVTPPFNGGTFNVGISAGDYVVPSGLPLPVELTSFSAQVNEGEVTLNWETETEVDNYGFNIERKTKEERRETWEVIGFVEGHGNSNSPKQYSFTDKNPVGGSNFSYRLKQIDTDGKFEYSDVVEVLLVPEELFLSQNFPNPFNPSTTIEFSLSQTSHVTLEVFNTLGERVGVLASEELSAGTYNYKWDASNLTSGIYFYILQTGDFIQTRKMILLK